ncbi:MAG TPA: hypothetical protein PLA11_08400 [Flavobacteriales bacterium]|nr:hypothetical protein [Flavobacteriales bacterium]
MRLGWALLILLPAMAGAQSLAGSSFQGTGSVQPRPGCEGCGNADRIAFLEGLQVDLLMPGSDIMDRRGYARKGDRIELDNGMVGELRGDSLFLNAYGHRHVFLRSMD